MAKIYKILKDNFILGVARGKNKAVERLKKEIEFHGWSHLATWTTHAGIIICNINNGSTYTIEEERE